MQEGQTPAEAKLSKKEVLKQKVLSLPEVPGVYKYYDQNGVIIYVGKAKNLKKRVASYFSKDQQDRKTRRLVSQIRDVKFAVVNSELDALLLENNLIKEYKPKYNILLKDDKTYPFICVGKERFPKVYISRRPDRTKCTSFGPYPSGRTLQTLQELFKNLFHIRTCNYALTEENIQNGKFKICLEHHLGNCKGPCEDLQSEEDYMQEIEQIRHILKGNLSPVKNYLTDRMQLAATEMNFEKAQKYKSRLSLLDNYQSKSVIVSGISTDIDVLTIVRHEKAVYANYMRISNGAVLTAHTGEAKYTIDETDEDLLLQVFIEMQKRFGSQATEVLTNLDVEIENDFIKATKPQRGDKARLVELSLKNIFYFRKEKLERK